MTLLSSDSYLEGVLCLAQSLRDTDPRYPLLVMITDELSQRTLRTLRLFGLDTRSIQQDYTLPPEVLRKNSLTRWVNCINKLEVFALTDYDKVVYLDADMMVVKNIDSLFDYPHPSAVVYYGRVRGYEHWNFPNAGLLVIEPAPGLSKRIFATWPGVVAAYPTFSDQDLIHAYYRSVWEQTYGPWEIPVKYNACVFLLDRIAARYAYNLQFALPDESTVAVLHFSSPNKPWATSWWFRVYFFSRKVLGRKWLELRAYRRYHYYLTQVRRAVRAV